MRPALLAALVLAAGCATSAPPTTTVPLIIARDDDVPARVHAHVVHQDEPALLLLDTGSALTFLFLGADAERFVPEAGAIEVGGSTVTVPGRSFERDAPIDGLPVVGLLGVDYLIAGTTVLDTARGELRRHAPGSPGPATEGWSRLAIELVEGHLIARVQLDGEPARLMVDTGSQHVLWLGRDGRTTDVEVTTTDATGGAIALFVGEVELVLAGDAPVDVPVLRAPSFPYFERTVEKLGGDIDGLLGLSAFRGRTIVVDAEAGVLWLEPARRPDQP